MEELLMKQDLMEVSLNGTKLWVTPEAAMRLQDNPPPQKDPGELSPTEQNLLNLLNKYYPG